MPKEGHFTETTYLFWVGAVSINFCIYSRLTCIMLQLPAHVLSLVVIIVITLRMIVKVILTIFNNNNNNYNNYIHD